MIVNDLQPRAEASACAVLDGRFGPAQALGVGVVHRARTAGMSASWTGSTAATTRGTSAAALTPAHVKAIAVAYPHLQAPPS